MNERAPDDRDWLTERFEADRPRLRAVATRMLGSQADADDAVQETWLRLARSGAGGIENVEGWLTTVVSRVCLDVLRARGARRGGEPDDRPRLAEDPEGGTDPEREAVLAESVGGALLVVLAELGPPERVAFVLHDLFDIPFDTVAEVLGRSPAAVRQLASRARRRVRGASPDPDAKRVRDRAVAEAFLAASRDGDVGGLLAVLAPEVVFRADVAAVAMGGPAEVRGAPAVARAFAGRATGARLAAVDDGLGLVVEGGGRLRLVLLLTVTDSRIVGVEAVADPGRLRGLHLQILDG